MWLKRMMGGYVFKFLLPVALGAGLLFVMVFLQLLPLYRSTLLEKETRRLDTLTDMGVSVVERFHKEAAAGRMPEAQAQRQALETLRRFRYGANGENYFLVMRALPGEHPVTIMHPTLPLLVGTPVDKLDAKEQFFFKTVGNGVRERGECHINYTGRKPSEPINASPKVAYAVGFRPWNWIVCSTMFLNDAVADIRLMGQDMWWFSVLVMTLVGGLAGVTVWQGRRAERRRVEAEQRLRLSERRYRILFEQSPDPIALIERGRYSDGNAASLKMLGLPDKESLVGKSPIDFAPERQPGGGNSSELAAAYCRTALEQGYAAFEWVRKRANGELFPAEMLITAIPLDSGDHILHVVGRDITERKRNEQELTERRARLEELVKIRSEELVQANAKLAAEVEEQLRLENDIHQILDASGDALCVVKRDFTIAHANEAYAKLVGRPPEEVVGHKCHELLPERNCGTPDCQLLTVVASGQKLEADVVKTRPDGSTFPCLLTCAPYLDASGAVAGVVQTFKDMTKRSKAMELEKLDALQQGRLEMSNNLLHDIGNAVTSAGTCVVRATMSAEEEWAELGALARLTTLLERERGRIEALFGPDAAAELAEVLSCHGGLERRRGGLGAGLGHMSRSITHINAILNIQRRYLRDVRTDESLVDMARLLDDALGLQARELEHLGVKVARHYDPAAPPLPGDPARLIQATLNLLRNACEAFAALGRHEGNVLSVSVAWDEAGLTVAVTDNAGGFASSTAEQLPARGDGLRESRSIVAAHHGQLSLSSPGEGEGATAKMVFPATAAPAK